jgi:hypothetical protein
MTRNRPKHAVYGVTQGVNQFGTSLASGVAGLVVCISRTLRLGLSIC